MKYFVTILLFLGFALPDSWGISPGSGIMHHVLFPLVHANIFHMLGNAVALLSIWKACGRYLVPAILIDFICSYIPTFADYPLVVGASGVLFSMAGMLFGCYRLWRNLTYTFLLNVGLGIGLSMLYSRSIDVELHAYCLVVSYLVGFLWTGRKR